MTVKSIAFIRELSNKGDASYSKEEKKNKSKN